MSHRRSAVKGSLSFSHPAVRAWLFQIIAIVAVVLIAVYLIHNTITNLNNRGITSGFAFLDRSAFSILLITRKVTRTDAYSWSVY